MPEALTTFPQFQKLPTEIRHQIWKLASLRPRLVEHSFLGLASRTEEWLENDWFDENMGISIPGIPQPGLDHVSLALLAVNHESRAVVRSSYSYLFGPRTGETTSPSQITDTLDDIFLNPDIDLLCIDSRTFPLLNFKKQRALDALRYLAVRSIPSEMPTAIFDYQDVAHMILPVFEKCEDLKMLVVCIPEPTGRSEDWQTPSNVKAFMFVCFETYVEFQMDKTGEFSCSDEQRKDKLKRWMNVVQVMTYDDLWKSWGS